MHLTYATNSGLLLAVVSIAALSSAIEASYAYEEVIGHLTAQIRQSYSRISAFLAVSDQHAQDVAASYQRRNVRPLTMFNHRRILEGSMGRPHSPDWSVFITGGNKTCLGRCEDIEHAWNNSVAAIQALPAAPSLAVLNCETSPQLCNAWLVTVPSIVHLSSHVGAHPGQHWTEARISKLSLKETTSEEIFRIHEERSWQTLPLWEGVSHPLDGPVAWAKLNLVLGAILWFFTVIPGWAVLVATTLISRTFILRPRKQGARAEASTVTRSTKKQQ